ncbi:MAG: hypothetical protein WCC17_21665 [Candidatus Nitrosopolaris sp.]
MIKLSGIHQNEVTWVICRNIKPGRQKDYDDWIERYLTSERKAPGYVGTTIIIPEGSKSSLRYIIHRDMGKFTGINKAIRRSKQLLRAISWDSYWFGNVVCSTRLENSNIINSATSFKKQWPMEEQQALVNKMLTNKKVILPVWHNVTSTEVYQYSPLLAGKFAVRTRDGTDKIAETLVKEIRGCEYVEKILAERKSLSEERGSDDKSSRWNCGHYTWQLKAHLFRRGDGRRPHRGAGRIRRRR